ncbi:hypothetical protein GNI_191280 [Gregarina niphandrodes]|uniref:Reverse transcriptase RNase H-like domain-containing protein n=1 Tax=Gregarina niphandrodes TaxID=110365 RepID=A0A023AWD1_GRENI|nr:hypothetical protein GNI_191280 [Gregarina niphandrodes]EZG43056.1 hypothetical protein GNI_191280 [Gregarina niphandrodes]|eukprot:XP_011133671.1 hypothetical protein GNI_191280 [Gregarina niphandrodes]
MNSRKTQSFAWRDSHEVAMRQVIEDLVNADYYPMERDPSSDHGTLGERGLWAVKYFVTKWPCIRLRPTLVLADHRNLTFPVKADTGKVGRWALFLQQYDLKFGYVPGDDNYVADALSRLQDDEDHDRDLGAMHIGNRPFAVHFAEVSEPIPAIVT